jgi:hypothetical protein
MTVSSIASTVSLPAPVAPQKPAAAAAAPTPALTPVHTDTVSISTAHEAPVAAREGDSDAS